MFQDLTVNRQKSSWNKDAPHTRVLQYFHVSASNNSKRHKLWATQGRELALAATDNDRHAWTTWRAPSQPDFHIHVLASRSTLAGRDGMKGGQAEAEQKDDDSARWWVTLMAPTRKHANTHTWKSPGPNTESTGFSERHNITKKEPLAFKSMLELPMCCTCEKLLSNKR